MRTVQWPARSRDPSIYFVKTMSQNDRSLQPFPLKCHPRILTSRPEHGILVDVNQKANKVWGRLSRLCFTVNTLSAFRSTSTKMPGSRRDFLLRGSHLNENNFQRNKVSQKHFNFCFHVYGNVNFNAPSPQNRFFFRCEFTILVLLLIKFVIFILVLYQLTNVHNKENRVVTHWVVCRTW